MINKIMIGIIVLLIIPITLADTYSSENYQIRRVALTMGGQETGSETYNTTPAGGLVAYPNTTSDNYNAWWGLFRTIEMAKGSAAKGAGGPGGMNPESRCIANDGEWTFNNKTGKWDCIYGEAIKVDAGLFVTPSIMTAVIIILMYVLIKRKNDKEENENEKSSSTEPLQEDQRQEEEDKILFS